MKLIQLFVCTCFSVVLGAQSNIAVTVPQTVRKGIIYKSEWSIDAAIHTNGFYLGYNIGKIKSYHTTTFLHFDLGLLFHPLETGNPGSNSFGYQSFNSYKFGKQNQLINLRVGKGIILTLSEKARTKGIAVGLRLEGGFDLGILKPYYLKLREEQDGIAYVSEKKYSEGAIDFLDPNQILGSASFIRGFDELSIIPGAFGRVAFRFDLKAFEKVVGCLETGIQLDIYSRRPPIMIIDNNPYTYINFYINLQLGSRKS